ncbi:hypothetical protein V6N13_057258 [Hibiscus sabdariffa]
MTGNLVVECVGLMMLRKEGVQVNLRPYSKSYIDVEHNGVDAKAHVKERLDRFVANVPWHQRYGQCEATLEFSFYSDHCYILIDTDATRKSGLHNEDYFKFDNCWAYEEECKEKLKKDIEALLDKEEIYWKQRSRVQWLREGDRNTTFSHARARGRRKMNAIRSLTDEQGEWKEGEDQIFVVANDFFQRVYQSMGAAL